MFMTGLILGLALFAVYTAFRCFFRVQQGHLAVLTSFGAALEEEGASPQLKTFGPGLHRKWPWQVVHDVPMMEQNLDLSGEEGGQNAMAADGTILRFDSILRYAPVKSQLRHFLFGVRSPIEHMTGLFSCLLRNEIANFGLDAAARTGAGGTVESSGSYAIIRRERRLLNQRIEEFSRKKIGERYGVRFGAVDLTDILPPDELANALNAVINAQTEAEAAIARAEAECQQRVLAAEHGVEIAQARARAAEIEIGKLGTYLTELDQQSVLQPYVSRRRAEVTSEARVVYRKG